MALSHRLIADTTRIIAKSTTESERELIPKLVGSKIVDGAGHFVPHEKPEGVTTAVIDALTQTH